MAYTEPTSKRGVVGEVAYLPAGVPITAENARGRIVMRDLPKAPVSNALILAFAHYASSDLLTSGDLGSYDRPFLTSYQTTDEEAATRAGAVGFIKAFDVPRRFVAGYYSSHTGTILHIPGVWVGVDEREKLKRLAAQHRRIRLRVSARLDRGVMTRNVIATLPGQSAEKMVVATNSDGNSYVQENGNVVLLALARHLAALPVACRSRTIEFVFGSSHLAFTYDGVDHYVREAIKDGSVDQIVFGLAAEHFGTREILPVARKDGGPGFDLAFTGRGEPYAWFAPSESPVLSTTLSNAVAGRGDQNTIVLRGLDAPSPGRLPVTCNFGGLANTFHGRLIPAIGGISGPWSMWSPAFGIDSLDFARMRSQALVVGDTLLALDDQPRDAIAGLYPSERVAVQAGTPTCDLTLPQREGPRPGGQR